MSSRTIRLTDRDREVLAFAAEHRLVLERQVERLVGVGPGRIVSRLGGLVRDGYLATGSVDGNRHYQIRARGLAAIGSSLPVPKDKLGTYTHDVGLAWLWLTATEGAFGPLRETLSERRMRSHDRTLDRSAEPFGVRNGGYDRFGSDRLHYPDLLLIDRYGRRLALELELSSKGRERTELIIGGYGADPRIARVLYLIEAHPAGHRIRRSLEQTVREMRLSDRIRFQLIEPFSSRGDGQGAGPERSAARMREHTPALARERAPARDDAPAGRGPPIRPAPARPSAEAGR